MASAVPSTVAAFSSSASSSTVHRSSSRPLASLHWHPCPPLARFARRASAVFAQTLDFPGSLFGNDKEDDDNEDDEDEGPGALSFGPSATLLSTDFDLDKEMPKCPPGLRQYESMVVLRPDMSEEERIALIEKYEELLVAGGGMYVEVFNRGVLPLSYEVRKKDYDGVRHVYSDGIYVLFTFFTQPKSLPILESTLKEDFDVIRAVSTKVRYRKY